MRTALLLVIVAGCVEAAPPVARPSAWPEDHMVVVQQPQVQAQQAPPQVATEPRVPHAKLPVGPVDCQDQAVLELYGDKHATPPCAEGTTAERPPSGEKCYWSLERSMDGTIGPPTHECHPDHQPRCEAHLVRKVREDGVVVTVREACP